MSVNLLLERRRSTGHLERSVIAGVVTQFWSICDAGIFGLLVVDMPPGTGDVPLTVFYLVMEL